jgi:hypothetical protein
MRRAFSVLFLLTLACATQQSKRPATIPPPDLNARLANRLFFGSGYDAPATIEVSITNRAQVPLAVRRVEVDAPGMRQFTLRRANRIFNETIPPGETKVLTLFTSATANTENARANVDEPLLLRVMADFEAEGARWREVLMMRE